MPSATMLLLICNEAFHTIIIVYFSLIIHHCFNTRQLIFTSDNCSVRIQLLLYFYNNNNYYCNMKKVYVTYF